MIIGITGKICAGHDSVGKILEKFGFIRLSLSDALRELMREKAIELSRKSMQDFGDDLRKEHGKGVLAQLTLKKIKEGEDYVIESIRNPGEIEELRKRSDFLLVMVDAPQEIRFKRLLARSRDPDEPKTLEDFIAWEKRDLGVGQPAYGQQQSACFELADCTINNDGSLEELREKVEQLINSIGQNT